MTEWKVNTYRPEARGQARYSRTQVTLGRDLGLSDWLGHMLLLSGLYLADTFTGLFALPGRGA